MNEPADNPQELPPPPTPIPPEPTLAPPIPPPEEPRKPFIRSVRSYIWSYFAEEPLTLVTALVPMCFLSIALYTRHPRTNFIFDEQEALLANPYVRSVADPASHLHWLDAFRRDFWGLPHDRTIGSYRPLPDLVWRFFWMLGARDQSPFLHHWVNVLLHGLNGALMVLIAMRVTKDRAVAWLVGATFTAAAVVTEAVSGVVGLADVLGALGALLALVALALPMWAMPWAVFGSTLIGLYSKESALCIVPLVPFACLLAAHITHPKRPAAWLRMSLCAIATVTAFVFYVEQRRRSFPASLPPDLTFEANIGKPWSVRFYHSLLRWYAQPILPKDPLNNPFVDATTPQRIAGGLRVYARGLGEVLLPYRLSGDYSSPQEPIPSRLVFPESVIGAVMLVGPLLVAPVLGAVAAVRTRRLRKDDPDAPPAAVWMTLVAIGAMWIVVSYFPVSNIPILLPTVRAERFWYFPVIGSSFILGLLFTKLPRFFRQFDFPFIRTASFVRVLLFTLLRRLGQRGRAAVGIAVVAGFFVWQSVAARAHANDYTDDLVFWNATRKAVPRSAKAHLNYSVMQGARNNLEERKRSNAVALELAPEWPMANIYMGDTICRMHHPDEAWPHYKRGFELAPNDPNLIALALQCLWDENYYPQVKEQLAEMGTANRNSWLDFLQSDMDAHGQEHNGVDPKYRPRNYNEGPKSD